MKKISLLLIPALMLLASCSLQQTILKGGCTLHEFADYNPVNSTDSTGFYVVCDNATLAKQYPKLTGQVLKLQKTQLQQAPLK